MLFSVKMPNVKIIAPDKAFTAFIALVFIFALKKLTTPLRVSHQAAEPINTPTTIPQRNPQENPSDRDLRMQSTPMGPTGAAIEKPMAIPLNKKDGSMAPQPLLSDRRGRTVVSFAVDRTMVVLVFTIPGTPLSFSPTILSRSLMPEHLTLSM